MAKKKGDGFYYEEIVTWKKKPSYRLKFLGSIILALGVCYMGIMINSINDDDRIIPGESFKNGYISGFDFFNMVLGLFFALSLIISGPIYIFTISAGEGKKKKYRRIGK